MFNVRFIDLVLRLSPQDPRHKAYDDRCQKR